MTAEKQTRAEELKALRVPELKDMANELGVEGYKKMKEDELIEAIIVAEVPDAPEVSEESSDEEVPGDAPEETEGESSEDSEESDEDEDEESEEVEEEDEEDDEEEDPVPAKPSWVDPGKWASMSDDEKRYLCKEGKFKQ